MAKQQVSWKDQPEKGDVQAAFNYLTLQLPAAKVRRILARARRIPAMQRIAKDLLRASGLPLLPPEESHVAQDMKKIRKGKALSPIILLQGDLTTGRPLIIADGYHRMCAAYHFDEDASVNAVLVHP
jgi:hypothetical protein